MDRTRMGPLHVRVLVLCALVAFLDGYDLQSMASAIPTLAADWEMAPGDLRWIATAALMGVAGAALFISPLGDYVGRRTMLLASFGLVALATVMTATAKDANALFAWRLVTGIGLGASMPNALALAAEYVPSARRVALVTLLAAGLSLGGACSGFLAPVVIAFGGWRAIFATGGAAMLLLWLPLLALPESVRFMVARAKGPGAIGRLLEQLDPGYRHSTEYAFTLPTGQARGVSVRQLFMDGLAPTTVTLWVIFFLNLGLLFLLASWLPVLLQARGLPLEDALRYAGLFQIGGVIGGFLLAWLIKRWGPFVVLIATYAAAAAALLLLSSNLDCAPAADPVTAGHRQWRCRRSGRAQRVVGESLSNPRPRDGRWLGAGHRSRRCDCRAYHRRRVPRCKCQSSASLYAGRDTHSSMCRGNCGIASSGKKQGAPCVRSE